MREAIPVLLSKLVATCLRKTLSHIMKTVFFLQSARVDQSAQSHRKVREKLRNWSKRQTQQSEKANHAFGDPDLAFNVDYWSRGLCVGKFLNTVMCKSSSLAAPPLASVLNNVNTLGVIDKTTGGRVGIFQPTGFCRLSALSTCKL